MERETIFSLRKYGKQLCAVVLATVALTFTQGVSADEVRLTQPYELQITVDMTEYRLQAGDTLWAVSEKIGMNLSDLANYNNVDLAKGEDKRLPIGFLVKWPKDRQSQNGSLLQPMTEKRGVQYTSDFELEQLFLNNQIDSVELYDGLTYVRLKDSVSQDTFKNLVSGGQKVTTNSDNETNNKSTLVEKPIKNVEMDQQKESEGSKPVEVVKPEIPSVSEPDNPAFPDKEDAKSDDSKENIEKRVQPEEPIEVEKPSVSEEESNLADKIYFLHRFKESSDMILVESNGKFGLVDVGYLNKPTADTAIKFMKDKGIKELDFIYLTHYDLDHWTFMNTETPKKGHSIWDTSKTDIYGRTDLLEDFKIKEVYLPVPEKKISYETPVHQQIVKTLEKYKIPYSFKENFEMGDFVFTTYNNTPLTQEELDFNGGRETANFNSRGLLVEKGDYDVLLNGDIEQYDEKAEAEALVRDTGTIDVLKAGHHGYVGSNTNEFMSAISPKVTVVTNSRLFVEGDEERRLESYSPQGVYFAGLETIEVDMTNLDQGMTVGNGQTVYTTITNNSGEGTRLDRESTPSSSETASVADEEMLLNGAN